MKLQFRHFSFYSAAAIGFLSSEIRNLRKAKRDKRAFLGAIGMELDALGAKLDDSILEVQGSTDRVKGGGAPVTLFICHTSRNSVLYLPHIF